MNLPEWCHNRPATTVVGSFRPEVISGPGYRTKGGPSRQNAPGSVETTPAQRAALQGYPAGFEFAGSKSKVSLMLGNCVPPPLAVAVLRAVWDD